MCLDQRYDHKTVLAEFAFPIVKSKIGKWKHFLYVGIFYLIKGLCNAYHGPGSGQRI